MPEHETPFEFPCEFPIKAMGYAEHPIEKLVFNIVSKYVANFSMDMLRTQHSKNGKYVSVTAIIYATSKEQLDNIYKELSSNEHIIMAL